MRAAPALPFVFVAGIAIAACNDSQPGTPTSPDLRAGAPPSAGCSYSTIKKDVDAEWPNSAGADTKATNSNVSALVTTMQQNAADSSIATATGFQILDTLANQTAKKQAGTTPAAGSQLALDLLKCMDVPKATIPTSFVPALSDAGAFAVRGRGPADSAPVVSHDGAWNIQPVFQTASTQYSWIEIEVADSSGSKAANLTTAVKQLFLAFGSPQDPNGFTNDDPLNLPPSGSSYSTVYNWATAPKEFFRTPSPDGPGFLISQCPAAGVPAGIYQSGFIQHNTATNSPEVLGFADPVCVPGGTASLFRKAPQTLAQRLWQIFRPEPAYAAVLGGGSGSKGSNLSPWGVIDPGVVNLTFNQTPDKKNNTVGVPLFDTKGQRLHVQTFSKAGTPFKQGTIFAWIEAINNQGVNVLVCKNWAYTNTDGIATFTNAYLNKAGGYILTLKTVGAQTTTNSVDNSPLTVNAGTEPSSALFNVKNGTPNSADCSGANVFVFDPTKPADQQSLPPVPPGLSP
jgi:hypothetical protein